MISRRSLLVGTIFLPLTTKTAGASEVEKAPILEIDTLYPLRAANGALPQSFEGAYSKVLGRQESLNTWFTPLRNIQPEGAVLTDLRNGVQEYAPYENLDTAIVNAQLKAIDLSELGGKIASQFSVSNSFFPISLNFLGIISRRSVTLAVQTNFSSMQNLKSFVAYLGNLSKRGFQPLVIGNKENLSGPLFFSSISLALNSMSFHESLLSRKVKWNNKKIVNAFEVLYNFKRFMNKSVNNLSWVDAHYSVLTGDSIATFGTLDFANRIPIWMTNDLSLDALSFPKNSLQTREIEVNLQGFMFSKSSNQTNIQSQITLLTSQALQRQLINEFPHKLFLSNLGVKPWPGAATEQSRWKSRRFEPVPSLLLSLPPEFVSTSLAPAIRDVFDMKTSKQISSLCSKLQKDWQNF